MLEGGHCEGNPCSAFVSFAIIGGSGAGVSGESAAGVAVGAAVAG